MIMADIHAVSEHDVSSVLWENEIDANQNVTMVIYVSVAIFLVLSSFILAGIFSIPDTISEFILFGNIMLLATAATLARASHYDKPWIKYMLLLTLVFTFAAVYAIYTDEIPFFVIIPMVISCRYYSRRLTAIIAGASLICFVAAEIYSINRGDVDLSLMELYPGTVITVGEETWLYDLMKDVPYNEKAMLWNTLVYSVFIKVSISLIVLYFCMTIADRGKKMLIKQQRLTEETASVNRELNIASNIQNSALPNRFPAFPEHSEFDIFASMNTAREVGGDFYDFFFVDDDHLAIVIGDVSGKGVPASLFMMTSRTLIKTHARVSKRTPADILYATNEAISEDNREHMFVTVWLGILEVSSGKLTYADAGHERLLLRDNGEWKYRDKQYSGVGIGMFDPEKLERLPAKCQLVNQTIQLRPGDMILQYTDGVTEAKDGEGGFFGTERLLSICKEFSGDSPGELLTQIKESIDAFVKDEPQSDDITMLGLIYAGSESK